MNHGRQVLFVGDKWHRVVIGTGEELWPPRSGLQWRPWRATTSGRRQDFHGEAQPCRGIGMVGARRRVVRAGIRTREPLTCTTERGQ